MHSMWADMFALALPVGEKILRPLVVYVFLILGLRIAVEAVLVVLAGAVVGSAQMSKLDLVDGFLGVDIDRERDLQHLVALLPVYRGSEVDAPAVAA